MRRFLVGLLAVAFVIPAGSTVRPVAASALKVTGPPGGTPLIALAPRLKRLADHVGGVVAISISDLNSGSAISINGDRNLPAASTIKVPVMVEVFRQIELGNFTLDREVAVLDRDRDCGYGWMCRARWGSRHAVRRLLWRMIAASDNTATNMLIRLVGRRNVNNTMVGLGLGNTKLGDLIHSDGDIRAERTSANDMMRLLAMIARREIISDAACYQMLAILGQQRHNKYLPKLLPKGLIIQHKTGTLHDTVNDVGIVQLENSPYVISVLTTHFEGDDGERIIRRASRLTYDAFASMIER